MNLLLRKDIKKKGILKTVGQLAALTAIALVSTSTKVHAGVGDDISGGGNNIGFEVWKVIKTAAMWIMAGFAVKDIVESLNEGDHREVLKIMFKYGIAFACVAGMIKYFLWIDHMTQK